MSIQNVELKAGHIVVFSTGEYSDYGYGGHFVCLKDFSQEQMMELQDNLKSEERQKGEYSWALDNFIPTLIREGLLACINVHEIHIGSYANLELS